MPDKDFRQKSYPSDEIFGSPGDVVTKDVYT